MIFIVRTRDRTPTRGDVSIVHAREHPSGLERDLFCVGDEALLERLRDDGYSIVPLHDGWYADESGGGVAVWGNGRYGEVRSTPFDVVAQG